MDDSMNKITGQLPSAGSTPVVCSVISRMVDEQLFGTVSKTLIWFLLEYPAAFGAKAFEESSFPPAVKEHFSGLLKSTRNARLQLIKGLSTGRAAGIRFFIVIGSEQNPAIYQFHFPDDETLLSLDVAGVIAGEPAYAAFLRSDPLFLVCTNGRRDPCCARWGQPVFDDMRAAFGELVWQTSHIGGHRFAANVLCFPHGIVYGRVDHSETTNLVNAYRRGLVSLPNYRGRACFSPEVQAGEFFLRSQTGTSRIDAYRLLFVEEIEPGRWDIHFESPSEGKTFHLWIAGEQSEYQIYESCRSAEPSHPVQYRLIKFEESN
jgi:hypothetical protein